MKVYTKGGDKGKTSLLSGERVKKNHLRLETYGTVDELNSFIGLLMTEITDSEYHKFLKDIQNRLFDLSTHLAVESEVRFSLPQMSKAQITEVEKEIDRMNKNLPDLKYFILPGSCRAGALAHVCRSICRRAERLITSLPETEMIKTLILPYINRLSDYFFVLARILNKENNSPEEFYVP